VLALRFGGRTIAELQRAMTVREFKQWEAFYRLHPFDDSHLYYRPAALVASRAGFGSTDANFIDRALDWLEPPPLDDGLSDVDREVMRAFGMRPPRRG